MEQKKWIVLNDCGHGTEDVTICDSLEEANEAAQEQWDVLQEKEKEWTVIKVGFVTEGMLEDFAADKGTINWFLYKRYEMTQDCFDSLKLKK